MSELDQIRDQQRATWNKFSAGWKKWDGACCPGWRRSGPRWSSGAPRRSEVLDVAAGTGEPGLTRRRACPQGTVTVTDLAEEMLRVAEENAERRGLYTT